MTKAKVFPAKIPSPDASGNFKVSVEVMSWLKEDFGHKSLDSLILAQTVRPGTSLMDLVRLLAAKYPRFGKKVLGHKEGLTEYCMVIWNGKIISATELDIKLKEGDVLKLTPAFYGG